MFSKYSFHFWEHEDLRRLDNISMWIFGGSMLPFKKGFVGLSQKTGTMGDLLLLHSKVLATD